MNWVAIGNWKGGAPEPEMIPYLLVIATVCISIIIWSYL